MVDPKDPKDPKGMTDLSKQATAEPQARREKDELTEEDLGKVSGDEVSVYYVPRPRP
jgi:hypothetical protein